MKNISELPGLMAELLEACPDFEFSPRGIEIINEIADYSEPNQRYSKKTRSVAKFLVGRLQKTYFTICLIAL